MAKRNFQSYTGCSGKKVFFPRIFIILPPLPRRHWSAIGCTEIGQHGEPIEFTVHLCCVENFENLLLSPLFKKRTVGRKYDYGNLMVRSL